MKICPYCAEEIKAEAIKCKHCGSEMPEVRQKVVADQVKQDIARQKVMAVMDADWAKSKLNVSYLFILVGLISSIALFHFEKVNIHPSNLLSCLRISCVLMYGFWSLYWGIQIVHEPIKQWYSGLIVFESNIVDLIFRQIVIILGMYFITIPLAGLIVGALGGGIVRTLKCVAIANNNALPETIVRPQGKEDQIKPVESSNISQSDGAIKPIVAWSILGGIVVLIIISYFFIMRR